jgi:flagellar export protein FliJ
VTGPAFRFRLERVRAVRERKEKLAEQELAKAIQLRTSTESELRSVEDHLQAAHVEQRSVTAESTTIDATELIARQAFLERIEAQRRAQANELRQRESEVADRGVDLTAAASEHEMLKRLKERHRSEHDREAARREGNMLDEIAAVRFGRSPA